MWSTLSLVTSMAFVAAAPPVERVSSTGNFATLSQCVVSLIDEVEVPARVAGVLMSLQLEDGTEVREGLRVSKKQLLGKLDDADALARQKLRNSITACPRLKRKKPRRESARRTRLSVSPKRRFRNQKRSTKGPRGRFRRRNFVVNS